MKKSSKRSNSICSIFSSKATLCIFSVVLVLYSCSKWPDYNYEVVSLDLINCDNTAYDVMDAPTSTITTKAYVIRLEYMVQLVGNNKDASVDESGYNLANKVVSLNVFSLNDFDSLHPALSPLNNYFLYGESTHLNSSATIADGIEKEQIVSTYRSYKDAGSNDPWKVNKYLMLMKQPTTLGQRSFVVVVGFEDNTFIRDTINVNLVP